MRVPAKTPKIIQMLGKGLTFSIATKEPVVYLTFDDGPIEGLTPWILEKLDHYDSKATFFMVGDNVDRNPSMTTEIISRGHAIGNHTQNHMNGFKTRFSVYLANLELCAKTLSSHLPKDKPLLFRPPYGKISPCQTFIIGKMGYQIIMWDVLSKDYEPAIDPLEVVDNVLKHLQPGSIIVLHDNIKSDQTLRVALPLILKGIKEKGYSTANLWDVQYK